MEHHRILYRFANDCNICSLDVRPRCAELKGHSDCTMWGLAFISSKTSSREVTSDKLAHGVGLWRNRVWST